MRSIDDVQTALASEFYNNTIYAGVAELADALASGASDRKVVWVQVPSPAPSKGYKKDIATEKL